MSDELHEQLAAVQHEIWACWMRYLFSRCHSIGNTGHMMIPAELVELWQRQMDTPYAGLPEREQEADRHQADKVLAVLKAAQP